jgi:hypothetical protein
MDFSKDFLCSVFSNCRVFFIDRFILGLILFRLKLKNSMERQNNNNFTIKKLLSFFPIQFNQSKLLTPTYPFLLLSKTIQLTNGYTFPHSVEQSQKSIKVIFFLTLMLIYYPFHPIKLACSPFINNEPAITNASSWHDTSQ